MPTLPLPLSHYLTCIPVLRVAEMEALRRTHAVELQRISDELANLNGSAEHAYELLGLPKVKLVVGTAVSHSNVPLTTTHGTALRGSSIGREADTAADDLVAEELDSLLDATVG